MDAYPGHLPKPTPETRPFWDGARDGRLLLPWCEDCGKPHFYPRALCPFCLSERLDWRQASGQGTLHTYVINHRAAKGFTAPYVIAVVALAEGPRMLTNIETEGEPTHQTIVIDMPVAVAFRAVTDEITLPCFRPVTA